MSQIALDRYYWLHRPTGTKGQSMFMTWHAFEAGCVAFFEARGHFPMEAAAKLINKWNQSQPETWTYWL